MYSFIEMPRHHNLCVPEFHLTNDRMCLFKNIISASCGALASVPYGDVVQTYPLGGDATYTCNSGYDLVDGDTQRTCLDGGTWNGTEPRCIG